MKISRSGQLKIVQDPSIDTLISRYILINENIYRDNGRYGMDGFRIQIYSSSNRNAREESNKARAAFISKFPGYCFISHCMQNPGISK